MLTCDVVENRLFIGNKGLRKRVVGAEGRSRTDMGLPPPDFESGAYTNFATPASGTLDNKALARIGQDHGDLGNAV